MEHTWESVFNGECDGGNRVEYRRSEEMRSEGGVLFSFFFFFFLSPRLDMSRAMGVLFPLIWGIWDGGRRECVRRGRDSGEVKMGEKRDSVCVCVQSEEE